MSKKTVTIPDSVELDGESVSLVQGSGKVLHMCVGDKAWASAACLHMDDERELAIDKDFVIAGEGDEMPMGLNMPYVELERVDAGWKVALSCDMGHDLKRFKGFVFERRDIEVGSGRWGAVTSFSINGTEVASV